MLFASLHKMGMGVRRWGGGCSSSLLQVQPSLHGVGGSGLSIAPQVQPYLRLLCCMALWLGHLLCPVSTLKTTRYPPVGVILPFVAGVATVLLPYREKGDQVEFHKGL